MPLLDTFKSEQQSLKLIFPGKGALHAHPQRMDGFVEEAFASALWGLAVAGILFELVASFQESTHCLPWPWRRPRAVAAWGAVRKIRGTPRQRVGANAHEYCIFCSCTP